MDEYWRRNYPRCAIAGADSPATAERGERLAVELLHESTVVLLVKNAPKIREYTRLHGWALTDALVHAVLALPRRVKAGTLLAV